jgi:hypothetical protein
LWVESASQRAKKSEKNRAQKLGKHTSLEGRL